MEGRQPATAHLTRTIQPFRPEAVEQPEALYRESRLEPAELLSAHQALEASTGAERTEALLEKAVATPEAAPTQRARRLHSSARLRPR